MRRLLRDLDMLVDALDLPQDRVERMFERPVDGIPLRRPQLVEVRVDPLTRLELRLARAATQISRHFLAREDGLGDVVEHHGRDYISSTVLYTGSTGSTGFYRFYGVLRVAILHRIHRRVLRHVAMLSEQDTD